MYHAAGFSTAADRLMHIFISVWYYIGQVSIEKRNALAGSVIIYESDVLTHDIQERRHKEYAYCAC